MTRKPILLVTGVIVVILMVVVVHSESGHRSKRITSYTKHPIASWFSSCPSSINVLRIDGKHFEHVRGIKRFYLNVPNTTLICFVTDEPDKTVTYHLFDLASDEDSTIQAKSSDFGETIGAGDGGDMIETPQDGKITIYNLARGAKSTLSELANLASTKWVATLDLSKRKVLSQKTLYFDQEGRLILERADSPPF